MRLLLLSWNLGALHDFLPPTRSEADGERPTRLAYVGDAAAAYAERPEWAVAERSRLTDLGYELVDVSAVDGTTREEFDDVLASVDGVYVAGGETFFLLAALRRTGADQVLRARVAAGLPYVGVSAGAVLAGPSIEPIRLMDDPTLGADNSDLAGLGLVDVVVVPHADARMDAIPETTIVAIVAEYHDAYELALLGDDEALLVIDDEIVPLASPVARPREASSKARIRREPQPAAPRATPPEQPPNQEQSDLPADLPAAAAAPAMATDALRQRPTPEQRRAFRAAHPHGTRSGAAFARRAVLAVAAVLAVLGACALAIGVSQELAGGGPRMLGALVAMSAFSLLLMGGGVALAWAFLITPRLVRSQAEQVRLWQFAQDNALEYVPGARSGAELAPFADRGTITVADVVRTTRGYPVEFGNYRLEILGGSAGRSGRVASGGYAISRASTRLPHVRLESRSVRRLGGATVSGDQRIRLSGDFDERFDLFSAPEARADALELFSPDVLQRLEGFDVELSDDWVLVTSSREAVTVDPRRWEAVTAAMATMLGTVDAWQRDHDQPTRPEKSPDTVRFAAAPRSLRLGMSGAAVIGIMVAAAFVAVVVIANTI